MNEQCSLAALFFIFVYVGTFTIGGGLVAITLMRQTLVEKGMVSAEEFYNMVAVSESTPGPIGINMATYVGYSRHGIAGALVTTAGEVLPSIVCIALIARFFMKFHDKPLAKAAFQTLRPATTGVILVAAAQMFVAALMRVPPSLGALSSAAAWKTLFVWPSLAFYALALLLLFRSKVHPIVVIAMGAAFGMAFL